MKSLEILQNKFIDGVYDDTRLEVLELIASSKIPKEELLDIYRNNLYSTLTNTLIITYPKIYQLVGAIKFKEFCQEFIKLNRSGSGNLDDYGDGFANFFTEKEDGFLSDLAKLEWFKHRSYLAKDVPSLKIEELQQLSEEEIFDVKFKLHPSCFLFGSNYNLLGKTRQKQLKKKVIKRQVYFVIYRKSFVVEVKKISKGEFNFLKGAEDNFSLYQIYEKYKINTRLCLSKYLTNGVLYEFWSL